MGSRSPRIGLFHCYQKINRMLRGMLQQTANQLHAGPLSQRFSMDVLKEFLKHAVPDYLVRGTDFFPLRLSNKKMTTASTIAILWE